MKHLITLSLYLLISCTNKVDENEIETPKQIVNQEFQSILDSANLDGVILLFDINENTFYSNNYEKATIGHLPASTFKIPNSIIGLETGAIKNDSMIFKWDGEQRYLPSWEKDLNLKQAFQLSCVPCFQSVAQKIGVEKMNTNIAKLDYGKIEVDHNTLTNFWLVGNSKITAFEQIGFLQRFLFKQLPISTSTYSTVKDILKIKVEDNYVLSGKTGWSTTNGIDNGWYVGYLESNKNVYFFASNIEPGNNYPMDMFSKARVEVTELALSIVDTVN